MACPKFRGLIGLLLHALIVYAPTRGEDAAGEGEGGEEECRLLGKFTLRGYVNAEDAMHVIGGMFPIHFRTILEEDPTSTPPMSPLCEGFNFRGYRWVKAMIHAINDINKDPDLLPNITLGYQIYDTCYTMSKTVENSLAFLTGQNETTPVFRCSSGAPLAAVVGAGGSTLSIASSRILGLYYFPQVGYASSSLLLSDKYQFPTYLRTIPSDSVQSQGMAYLVHHFGWRWIGTIAADDDYGKYGVKAFKEKVENSYTCIAFSETIPKIYSREKLKTVAEIVHDTNATVIVVYSSDIDFHPLLEELMISNISSKTWIASEAWVTSALIARPEYFPLLGGAIGFGVKRGEIPGLKEFLLDVRPGEDPEDDLAIEFWQSAFNCTWPNANISYNTDNRKNVTGHENIVDFSSDQLCTGKEKLEDLNNTYLDISELRITYNVYKAVYAVANGLDKLRLCEEGRGPFIPGQQCAKIDEFEPWQLMYYMKNEMKFTVLGEDVDINEKGDVYTSYDVLNWQKNENGEIAFVPVGTFNMTGENDMEFHRPRSTCNKNCQPGYRKGILQGKPSCCYDCIRCAEGQISNITDARECIACKEDYWSNEDRSVCVLKEVEFLAYGEALGMTLIALSVFGACVVMAVTGVYIKFRSTALVKANDRELSFLIQFSLVVTLMTSILFIGKPEDWSCMSRQVTLALGFSLCLSCVLGKTVMLFLTQLAKNSKVAEKVRMSIRPIFQKIIVLNSVLVEVGIVCAYLILDPPHMLKNTQFSITRIIFECDEGSILYLCVMFGFDVFLAILCFLTAFVARKLPNNFNEAKFVTFGMLVFFIVWISFVPAYLSTRGKFKVAVEIFAILASSFGLLGCIFVPKCYIILLKPLRNTEEIVGGRAATNDKSAPPTSASCTSEVNNTTVSTVLED
ncbi:vomeronasal type-2 receptor 1-like isoform X2 [Rhineura floridana]|uniref:vomeronasal type-2 receptor 1-like isoform X2 n=1 Tax=Rhineura floridana TaxID=261503 RepID=UPI002AC817F9|nr:vomeronasal type-2 receptor 1-like isoform X2 [Rhineura floridana]